MKHIPVILLVLILASCTGNERARNFGGTEKITLEKGERLVNMTWKQDDLWLLTRQDTTAPQVYHFKEKSSYGMMEGEIIVTEQ